MSSEPHQLFLAYVDDQRACALVCKEWYEFLKERWPPFNAEPSHFVRELDVFDRFNGAFSVRHRLIELNWALQCAEVKSPAALDWWLHCLGLRGPGPMAIQLATGDSGRQLEELTWQRCVYDSPIVRHLNLLAPGERRGDRFALRLGACEHYWLGGWMVDARVNPAVQLSKATSLVLYYRSSCAASEAILPLFMELKKLLDGIVQVEAIDDEEREFPRVGIVQYPSIIKYFRRIRTLDTARSVTNLRSLVQDAEPVCLLLIIALTADPSRTRAPKGTTVASSLLMQKTITKVAQNFQTFLDTMTAGQDE